MCAFFDDCTNDNGERRLIFAGIRVENEEEKEARLVCVCVSAVGIGWYWVGWRSTLF